MQVMLDLGLGVRAVKLHCPVLFQFKEQQLWFPTCNNPIQFGKFHFSVLDMARVLAGIAYSKQMPEKS